MRYRLFVKHADGTPHTIIGVKHIQDDSRNPKCGRTRRRSTRRSTKDTVEAGQEAGAAQVAIGIIHIGLFDFMRQLTTFRVQGPNPGARIGAIAQFGDLFLGKPDAGVRRAF